MAKKPKTKEMVDKFLATKTVQAQGLLSSNVNLVFKPKQDLLYHVSEATFYLYDTSFYRAINHEDMRFIVATYLEQAFPTVDYSDKTLDDFINILVRKVPRKFRSIHKEKYLAFKNKLLNLDTFRLEDYSHDKICFFGLPYATTECKAETPNFDQYLASTFPNDPDLQAFVPALIGFYLLPSHVYPAAFFLVGDGENGKTVLLDTIEAIIGRQFMQAFPLKDLATNRFLASELVGKRLNMVNEDESKYLEGDRFKAMVTGEPIMTERKFGKAFTFRPQCRFLFATNDPPTFKNVNHGLKRRFHIIPFKERFAQGDPRRDPLLTQKIRDELPGVIGKSLRAVKVLGRKGFDFDFPTSMLLAKDDFIRNSSSAAAFIDECYEIIKPEKTGVAGWEDQATVFEDYRDWCSINGFRHFGRINFWKEVKNNVDGIVKEYRTSGGRKYYNVSAKADWIEDKDARAAKQDFNY